MTTKHWSTLAFEEVSGLERFRAEDKKAFVGDGNQQAKQLLAVLDQIKLRLQPLVTA
jgi:hypothetical protein